MRCVGVTQVLVTAFYVTPESIVNAVFAITLVCLAAHFNKLFQVWSCLVHLDTDSVLSGTFYLCGFLVAVLP